MADRLPRALCRDRSYSHRRTLQGCGPHGAQPRSSRSQWRAGQGPTYIMPPPTGEAGLISETLPRTSRSAGWRPPLPKFCRESANLRVDALIAALNLQMAGQPQRNDCEGLLGPTDPGQRDPVPLGTTGGDCDSPADWCSGEGDGNAPDRFPSRLSGDGPAPDAAAGCRPFRLPAATMKTLLTGRRWANRYAGERSLHQAQPVPFCCTVFPRRGMLMNGFLRLRYGARGWRAFGWP